MAEDPKSFFFFLTSAAYLLLMKLVATLAALGLEGSRRRAHWPQSDVGEIESDAENWFDTATQGSQHF